MVIKNKSGPGEAGDHIRGWKLIKDLKKCSETYFHSCRFQNIGKAG